MICNQMVEKYCSGDISKIENYDKAINDHAQTWHCHHRFEIQYNGTTLSRKELNDKGLYYNRPPEELIFLTKREHTRLHKIGNKYRIGKKYCEESRIKMSENCRVKQKSEDTKMTLFKIQDMKTKEVQWAKNRAEIQKLLNISKPTTTRLMKDVLSGGIGKSGSHIVVEVPVEVPVEAKEIVE